MNLIARKGLFSPAVKFIEMKSKGGILIGFDAVLNDTRLAYDFLLQFFLLGIIVGLVQQVICNNDNDIDNIFITKPQLKSYLQSTCCYKRSN